MVENMLQAEYGENPSRFVYIEKGSAKHTKFLTSYYC